VIPKFKALNKNDGKIYDVYSIRFNLDRAVEKDFSKFPVNNITIANGESAEVLFYDSFDLFQATGILNAHNKEMFERVQ